MPLDTPPLPTKFPCWCQAIYSWGGETKKDLGFVEGDLIECLNAGDGSWWMGRLRRDQRMVGLFPSNFVRVLGDDFAPEKFRKASPAFEKPSPAPQQKQKPVFRKPFQGYKEAVGPSEQLRQAKAEQAKTASTARTTVHRRSGIHSSSRPASRQTLHRSPSPAPQPAQPRPISRISSPAPPVTVPISRSPAPQPVQPRPISRIPSPAPPVTVPISRSPAPQQPVTLPPYSASPLHFPPSPFSGASHRSPAPRPRSPIPYALRPLKPPSPALSPARTPVENAPLVPQSKYAYDPQFARHDSFHSQGSRKRSGTYPSVRPPQPPPLQLPQRASAFLPPPEPLAPASPQHRAPSPNSIFAAHALDPEDDPYARRSPYHDDDELFMGGLSPSHDLDPSLEDAPPPPPPPHRVSVNEAGYLSRPGSSSHLSSRSGGSQQRDPRALTPDDGRTSAEYGNTPSPLRDAMEDVMSSLQDMGRPRGATSPGGDPVYTPWPAEDLEQSGVTSAPRSTGRPSTQDSWSAPQDTSFERYQEGPPQFSNYVQRMESRLRQLHAQNARKGSDELHFARSSEDQDVLPPLPSIGNSSRHQSPAIEDANARMGKRRSGFNTVGRSSTNRSSATNSSSGVQSTMTNLTNSTNSTGLTGQSVMSGYSASGFSATSAGSFARRGKIGGGSFNRSRPNTSMENHTPASTRPQSPATGPSYHSSHNTSRQGATSALGHSDYSQPSPAVTESERPVSPNKKKSGFFRKMIESARSAKSSAANSRSVKATSGAASPSKSSRLGSALSHSRLKSHSSSKDIGQGPADWVQVRRDVNRAITPSKLELMEKAERCQMMDFPVIYAIEDLYESAEGDEGIDGLPIEEPTDWANMNLAMVDKNTRYLGNIPATLSPAVLAQSYVCRPYRTDGQRLRAIFTWVSEKITWEEEAEGEVDVRKAIHMRRGSPREIAMLVQEMCSAVGIHSEVVEGYLKTPGEDLDLDCLSRPNHFWNTVLIDGEWRIMDCSLASPTHPGRYASSILNTNAAESWYFLARPMEICYTHVPLIPEQQHIVPPVADDVLLALPWVAPSYFKNGLSFPFYDTSITRVEGLEVVQVRVEVPIDIECAAEVETVALSPDARDALDGPEDVPRKRALAQPDWLQRRKHFTIKAVLPEDAMQGVLKVYAGKRGLMHSNKDIPYPLAFALPIVHGGENLSYDFVLRHPTPHAQSRDLYIVQPQCSKLAINNTFVFTVRQHPSSLLTASPRASHEEAARTASPGLARPASSLSMVSSLAHHSNSSTSSYSQQPFSASASNVTSNMGGLNNRKPAKLAIQSPAGKILRLTRKAENLSATGSADPNQDAEGSVWETVIKVGERGTWRALVLADRSNRWCVWAEWECI